jgi:hypothetical protein
LQLVRRFRISAVFCALAVLACELISRPFADMGICDDWPYILTAQHLAATGHVVYNGWAAAMIGWQFYLGAAFIKLLGMSLTHVRISTLLLGMAMAFLLQRTMVLANISERNATIGTLALVLSPMFLMLSATFMTDIPGLFSIVICLYGCMRALQARTSRGAIGWLCVAVAANAICGSSRQIAWLGVLVMVPSALWLLRSKRGVLLAGILANLAGAAFVFGCILWFKHQPYTQPEHLFVGKISLSHAFQELLNTFFDIPYLLLPVVALFLPEIRKSPRRVVAALLLGYLLLAVHPRHTGEVFVLEPTQGDWVGIPAIFEYLFLKGAPPVFFNTGARVVLTILSFGGLLGLLASHFRPQKTGQEIELHGGISWYQLRMLLAPFAIAYTLLLVPRATTFHLTDRYTLGLLLVALIYLVRYYQDQIEPRLPQSAVFLVAVVAVYGVAINHNLFALYRARAEMAAELRAEGVPDTSVDNGWEYNMGTELQHAAFLNDHRIEVPADAYVPAPSPAAGTCYWYFDPFPHIHARYGVSFDPNACYGQAPFAPVHYSRWLAAEPGTLYVVKYTPSSAADVARFSGSKFP